MGTILLVRHGRASFGTDNYDTLSEHGHDQAERLGTALRARGLRPARVVTGSLARQRSTAESIVRAAAWSTGIEEDARWDEFDHESCMGALGPGNPTDGAEYQECLEAAMRRWYAGEVGGTESWSRFADRGATALRDVAAGLASGEVAVVVTSAGVIAGLAGHLLGTGVEQWVLLNRVCVNTGVTTIVSGRRGLSLVAFNEHTHLPPEVVTYR